MNKYLKPVTMLKKRLYLWRFLTSSVNFYITTAFETLCELFYKFLTTASRFFIIEPTFCEHDKNNKFNNFKTHNNLFFNKVAFYFI